MLFDANLIIQEAMNPQSVNANGCGCSETPAAQTRSVPAAHHSIHLERFSNGKKVTITDNQVKPGETFRIVTNNVIWDGHVEIGLRDASGNSVYSEEVWVNIGSSAWADIAAPFIEGTYTAYADAKSNIFGGHHDATIDVIVTATAPDPPAPPPDSDWNFGSIVGSVEKLAIIGLIGFGLYAFAPLLQAGGKTAKKVTK